jgi:hypothetical protein
MSDEERIMQLLRSSDFEMIQLGAILALNKGASWCMEHLPPFGWGTPSDPDENQAGFIKLHNGVGHDCYGWKKDGILIVLRAGYLMCRPFYQFRAQSVKQYKILDLETNEYVEPIKYSAR